MSNTRHPLLVDSAGVSPCIDASALLTNAWTRRGRRSQPSRNPFSRIGRIDHIVNLEVRRAVERLPMLIHPRDHLIEKLLARGRILHRRQLVAIAELDRAFESHAAEFAGRPCDREMAAP